MWGAVRSELQGIVREAIRTRFGVDHEPVVEVPPRRELGDLAFPAPLHLARQLKKPPRSIAEELLAAIARPPGVREVKLAGAGYLNVFLDRGATVARILAGGAPALLDV